MLANIFTRNSSQSNRGSALLLALLVLSSAVTSGLIISRIVIKEFEQSRNLDQSVIAYYGADSGLEQALYYWRKDRANFPLPEVLLGEAVGNTPTACNFDYADFLPDSCRWYHTRAASRTFQLIKGQVKEINMYNETVGVGFGVESLAIIWQDLNPGNDLEPWLEMEIVQLRPDFSDGTITNLVRLCSDNTGGTYPLADPAGNTVADCGTWERAYTQAYFDGNLNYKVRFRSLYDDVRVTVSAYDSAGDPASIGRRLFYTAGAYKNAQQSLMVDFSDYRTAKSIADYVIFSDCDLVKGTGLDSTCP